MIDNAPPLRSEVTGGLATLACAVCCALPLPTAAGVLTVAGAALLEKTLLAIAAGLAALAMGVWWPHRRRSARHAATADAGCGGCGSTLSGCDTRKVSHPRAVMAYAGDDLSFRPAFRPGALAEIDGAWLIWPAGGGDMGQ